MKTQLPPLEPKDLFLPAQRRENMVKFFAFVSIVVLFFLILLKVKNMLVSFTLAFVINYLLSPFVNRLERTGLSRTLSIVIPFIFSGVLMWLSFNLITPLIGKQITHLRAEFPRYLGEISKLLAAKEEQLNQLFNFAYQFNLSESIEGPLIAFTTSFFGSLPSIASNLFTVLLLAPFFAFFMLKDGRSISKQVLALVPNSIFELALNLMHQLNSQLGDFIRARLLEALIVGGIVWAGLEITGFPYAVVLGIFAALTNLIPYVGPFIGAIPTLILAAISGASPLMYLWIILTYLVAQLVDIMFIIPLVVAKIVDLHPATVVIAIIIGSQLMGVLGMIISIPVASALKLITQAIFSHLIEFRH